MWGVKVMLLHKKLRPSSVALLAKWREPLSWDLAHLYLRLVAVEEVVVVVVAVGAAEAVGVEAVARHDPLRVE